MERVLVPGPLGGTVPAMASKSLSHRHLLAAALCPRPVELRNLGDSRDIAATRACLAALHPGGVLPCGESGSTLRFLLPVAGALGIPCTFSMEGRLPRRPLSPLDRELEAHGLKLTRPEPHLLSVSGQLEPGDYVLPGNVSSQFISGLLFALPLLSRPSTLTVAGTLESAPYVALTQDVLAQYGVIVHRREQVFHILPGFYHREAPALVEGDWSNAAFWLCAGALGHPVTVTGLNPQSLQGDRAICGLLTQLGAVVELGEDRCTVRPGTLRPIRVDAGPVPDLIPILALGAACAPGESRFTNAGRLRLKESDRLAGICALLTALGGRAAVEDDTLVVTGGRPLTGGTVDPLGDHRLAMTAAIAGTLCPVTLLQAQCVAKSDPRFWETYDALRQKGASL